MRRLAIIDHDTHTLYVDDVDEKELEENYKGDEQAYIEDNYVLLNNYSWDWVTDAIYYKKMYEIGIDIDFDKLIEE